MKALRQRMETMLKAQDDPRMDGHGRMFDNYILNDGDGLVEKHLGGEAVKTSWVNPTDFEEQHGKP